MSRRSPSAEPDSTAQPDAPVEPDPTAAPAEPNAESAEPAESTESTDPPLPKRRRTRRIVLIVLLVLALLIAGGVAAAAFYVRSVDKDIRRVDAFQDVPVESRPEKVAHDAMNLLILGSDSRDPENVDGSRSDTIIIAHLPKDRSSAQLISIPRDTWVPIPATKDHKHGGRDAKINASFAWGGIPLMVQTVEKFSGVRIDHVVNVDFAGFQEIVDALGGIDIEVDQNFTSIHEPYRKFTKGTHKMDGATALDYARQRKQFADGDFARIRHQQQVIKAILDKGASAGLLANPTGLNSFIKATTGAISVDKTLSIFDMATQLRHLRSGDLAFYTSPTKGTGQVGDESVVFADKAKAKVFYDAVRRDAVPDIVQAAK
jgi:LCP family protein required for cell wall assembly